MAAPPSPYINGNIQPGFYGFKNYAYTNLVLFANGSTNGVIPGKLPCLLAIYHIYSCSKISQLQVRPPQFLQVTPWVCDSSQWWRRWIDWLPFILAVEIGGNREWRYLNDGTPCRELSLHGPEERRGRARVHSCLVELLASLQCHWKLPVSLSSIWKDLNVHAYYSIFLSIALPHRTWMWAFQVGSQEPMSWLGLLIHLLLMARTLTIHSFGPRNHVTRVLPVYVMSRLWLVVSIPGLIFLFNSKFK